MTELDNKKDIELEVRRLFSEDAATHREYLEKQFTQLKWSVGILVLLLLGTFWYVSGRTAKEAEEYIRSRVDERVIDYKVQQQVKDRLFATIEVLANSDEVQNQIKTGVQDKVNTIIGGEAGKLINDAALKKVSELNTIDISKALLPRGTIVAWSGSKNTIPAGWALCEGLNGTPDLRDRFIVGAGGGYAPGITGSRILGEQSSKSVQLPFYAVFFIMKL